MITAHTQHTHDNCSIIRLQQGLDVLITYLEGRTEI